MAVQRIGGSFAPPLTDELLAAYKAMIEALPPQSQIRDAMARLLACCEKWWELPDSIGTEARAHPSGLGTIVPLEAVHQKALWEHIPWPEELEHFGVLFDGIDPVAEKPLRDAAHHLLWHAKELELDREPLTADKL